MAPNPESTAAPARITLLCLDVDGVLTDGSIIVDASGVESKRFSVRDGLGIKAWLRCGNRLAVVTGRGGPALRHRMSELGVDLVHERVTDKAAVVRELQRSLGVTPEATAFMGDDLADLPGFEAAGYALAPADADPVVRERAAWVAGTDGGRGAVREAVEHLLRARGEWDAVVAEHLGTGDLA